MKIKKMDLLNGAAFKEMSDSDLIAVRNIFETDKEKDARLQKEKEEKEKMDIKRQAFEKDCEKIKEETHKNLEKLFEEIF